MPYPRHQRRPRRPARRVLRRRRATAIAAALALLAAAYVLGWLSPPLPAPPGTGTPLQRLARSHPQQPRAIPPTAMRDTIDRLTVHHTVTGATSGDRQVDATLIGEWHAKRGLAGPYTGAEACAYHFVILPDGTVQSGRPLDVAGSDTRNSEENARSIAVVLVGDFEPSDNRGRYKPASPTKAQLAALDDLALWAMSTFGFDADSVHGHKEVASSACPGKRMDLDALRERLAEAAARGSGGTEPPIVLAGTSP